MRRKYPKAVLCGLVWWCASLFPSDASSQEQSTPFVVGDSWVYRATQDGTQQGPWKEFVRAVRGNVTELLVQSRSGPASLWTYDHASQRYLVYSTMTPEGRADKVLFDFSFNEPAIKFPFSLGSTWTSNRRFKDASSGDDISQQLTGKAVARETIATPAGKFEAYRIELDGYWADEQWAISSTRGRATERYWYVPAVKRFVRREIVNYGYTNGKSTGFKLYERIEELVAFRLADGSGGGTDPLMRATATASTTTIKRMPTEFTSGTTRFAGEFVQVDGDAGYSGRGQLTWANGDKYSGTVVSGVPSGEGQMNYASGDRYEGGFKQGVPDGQGVYSWKSGSRYKGNWSGGKKQGRGVLTWPDGTQWEGEFVDDERKVQ